MAVVSKKKTVSASTKVEEKKTPVVKKTVEKAAPVEKKAAAPVKKIEGGRKLRANQDTKPKSFDIKEGSQATQEAFLDIFYKKLVACGFDAISKVDAKDIKKVYSETLKEVTNIASYKDVDAGMYYARRFIKPRVTEPPKANNGLKTLMNGHYELKVRKTLGDESEYKFFGELNEDGSIFIAHIFDKDGNDTGKTTEISLTEEEEVEVKPVKKTTKKTPVVEVEEEEVEEDIEESDDFDDDDFLEDEDDD